MYVHVQSIMNSGKVQTCEWSGTFYNGTIQISGYFMNINMLNKNETPIFDEDTHQYNGGRNLQCRKGRLGEYEGSPTAHPPLKCVPSTCTCLFQEFHCSPRCTLFTYQKGYSMELTEKIKKFIVSSTTHFEALPKAST